MYHMNFNSVDEMSPENHRKHIPQNVTKCSTYPQKRNIADHRDLSEGAYVGHFSSQSW